MVQIQLIGLNDTSRRLGDFGQRQLPFAVAKAMTATVKQAQAAETAHINTAFNRPTPFTQKAIGISVATRTNLAASVFVRNAQAKYLAVQAVGGQRELKTFEQRFAEQGRAQVALPGRGIALNQYGNITRAKIKRIAGDLNSSGGAKRFFAGKPKGTTLPSGVYARTNDNRHITPLLVFATDATYQKRFQFSELAQETITAKWEANLTAAWLDAVRTAR
ncbi:MAG: hypothetical protein K2X55_01045 [Burkholderiaceae bacterium]|nr:hypothetical protein [Burkholderiaceae bacterium]